MDEMMRKDLTRIAGGQEDLPINELINPEAIALEKDWGDRQTAIKVNTRLFGNATVRTDEGKRAGLTEPS